MEKISNTWKGKPAALFLFLACFFLFSWPLLSIPSESGGIVLISYLFLLWLLVILGLCHYCRNEAGNLTEIQRDEDHS
ncbi:MAG: hypothetical protein KJ630_17620 [Proteobacteria bacterium]|nr:hypothetical protein [Pseudomonadota bacterium]